MINSTNQKWTRIHTHTHTHSNELTISWMNEQEKKLFHAFYFLSTNSILNLYFLTRKQQQQQQHPDNIYNISLFGLFSRWLKKTHIERERERASEWTYRKSSGFFSVCFWFNLFKQVCYDGNIYIYKRPICRQMMMIKIDSLYIYDDDDIHLAMISNF